jgi:hypothetical protein
MMKLPLVAAALLLTLGFATAPVTTAAAAPATPVTTQAGEFSLAQWDDRRYRHHPRCRNVVHYGWKNRRCLRVEQRVCRNYKGKTYVTNRHITLAPRWRCRR